MSVVSDVRYLLIGNDSPSFTFASPLESLTVNIHTHETSPLLNDVLQLSLIVKKLSIISNPSSTNPSLSDINIAFLSSVHSTILDFHQFINDFYINNSNPSFIQLNSNLLNWYTIFRHIYYLYLKSNILKNHEFLSLLYDYSLVGDSIIKDLSTNYFNSLLYPYNKLINDWLFKGELANTESFISESFTFDKSLIPSFITHSNAFKIYQIGKSIHYLKNYLKDYEWCNKFYIEHKNDSLIDLNIDRLYEVSISHLDALILDDFESEINYLHKFLLFNQGDLINTILQNGSKILSLNSNQLSSNQLISLVQESIDSSSVSKNYSPTVYNRIDARLLNINLSQSTGYNLFTLDFKVKPHITFLISSHYKEYLRVFNFLFKLLNLKDKLSKSWKSRKSIKLKQYLSYQRKFDLIRHQFISFLNSIYSFIENELINNLNKFNSFNSSRSLNLENNKLLPFNSKVPKLFNIDGLIEIHSSYISSISRSELFTNFSLFQLILVIEKFVNLSTEFEISMNDLDHLNVLSLSTEDLEKYNLLLSKKIKSISSNLNIQIVNSFENNMTNFINSLKASTNKNLNYLSQILI